MMPKIYAYMFIVLAVIGFAKWGYSAIYDAGYNAHKVEVSDIKDNADTEGQKDVETVIKWRTETKVEYRDKIKKIYLTKGNESCLDATYTSLGL